MVNHFLAQTLNLLRSLFITLYNSAKKATEKQRKVSAPNSLAIPIIKSAISFINNKIKSGANTEPGGILALNIAS